MMLVDTVIEVEIDPTIRFGPGNQLTFTGFTQIRGDSIPGPGTMVLAVVPGTDEAAWGIVVAVNNAAALVYIAVAWCGMQSRDNFYTS